MEPSPPAPPGAAEALFAEYLERVEADEDPDFAAFCRLHPAEAASLQRIHVRWQAMTRAFATLSQDAGARTTASSPGLDAMRGRLQRVPGRLARYRLGTEIARGAMGRIVAAFDEELRRDVALKIHRGDAEDTRQQRRFFEEAQITAQLDHPGIVPVHELGLDDDGRPFFSMQLVRGRDLGAILAAVAVGDEAGGETDGWTRTRVLHVLLRVCEAMAFAHDKGVVHRDLKPANVMVGRFGETYVMDWGLARVRGAASERDDSGAGGGSSDAGVATLRTDIASEGADSALLTRYGDVLGTPAYMAPEQAAGESDTAAAAVDVYAVGAMLYHLLAGHMPYHAADDSADAVLARVRAGPPPRLGDDVPAELRAICEHAMARAPADRYAGMQALGDDLRAFLEVRTVRAYATGRFAELSKWVARNRGLAATAALLVIALVIGALAVTQQWMRADANAARLLAEVDRSAFRAARLALQSENSNDAAASLWRAHLAGRMPRATSWALRELAERDPYLVTLPLHADYTPLAFAPRIRAVLAGNASGRVEVRDDETLALRAELGDGGPAIHGLAVLGNGTLAVAGTTRGEVLQFDLEAGKLVRRSTPHTGGIRYVVAVGPTGFASGAADGKVLHWSTPDAEPVLVFEHTTGITALTAHPSGTGVAAGDAQGRVLGRAFDGSWGIKVSLGNRLSALAFDLPGHELWAGATDHNLRVIDLRGGDRHRSVPTRNGTCRQLARDHDGSFLLGGWWRIDRLSATGETLAPVALRGISRIAFDPQRRRLATSGVMCGLGIVDVGDGGRRHLAGSGVALSGDGTRVATFDRGAVEVRDVDTDAVVARLPGTSRSMRLDDDGAVIALADDGEIHVHDIATGARRFVVDAPTDTPFGDACVFSPNGEELVTRSRADDRVLRLDARDGHVIADYPFPGGRLIRTAWSADGRWLAAIPRGNRVVRLYDVRDGSFRDVEFPRDDGDLATLSALAVSADGGRVAVGTWQGTLFVRNRDGAIRMLAGHAGAVWSLQFAATDDALLFSAGGSQGIAAWDVDSSECCYQTLPNDVVTTIELSRDCRTLACHTSAGVELLDFEYRERHVAGNLGYHLARQADSVAIPAGRADALRAWSAAILARPWPRWRK